ncbi:hypothetical protein B6I21_00080 [candidate division KSB1 bacterium 4572_119]|nr:MAG: hypothetical protein B6I21_00080 [candidate division KSB1 bacterium 4572_119]
MRNRSILLIGLFFLIAFLFCSSGNKLRFQRPGQVSFAGIKRLVVAPCAGKKIARDLDKRLADELKKTNYFSLYFDHDINEKLWQHQLTYKKIAESDSQTCAQIGGWLKADGMLFPELKMLELEFEAQGMEKVEKEVWTGEYERNKFGEIIEEEDSSGVKTKKKRLKVKILDQKFQLRKARIEVFFRLIDFEVGAIISSWDKVEHYIDNTIIGEQIQELPSEREIERLLIDKVVTDFVAEIGPKLEIVRRPIETGFAEIDSGAVYARQNKWEKALEIWENAELAHPNSAKVYYNIGLALEALGDYKTSEMNYLKASLLDIENKLYQKAIKNIQKIWNEKEKNK